jgi:glyoxylase I family protein
VPVEVPVARWRATLLAMTVPVTGFAHIRLTVSDLARSRAFYDTLFGWDVAYELPADADEATREALGFLYGGIIYSFPGGLFGLRPVAAADDRFSEGRTGLDHLALNVASSADLDAAVEALDALGAPHGPVKDLGGLLILEFRDPDGIALELSTAGA